MAPLAGQYAPSPRDFVAEHVQRHEETGDVYAGPIEGRPTIILTTRGRGRGKLRKAPWSASNAVESARFAASKGGTPQRPP
ncbi:nitroreductase/quinone reductase family protein [Streptomyces mirabilis]|uniref:nitroreductase/quinone reductase family protein n=1 Tax=Streptomyces mirabilis TaxID=68239 RepID=UPI0036EA7CF3